MLIDYNELLRELFEVYYRYILRHGKKPHIRIFMDGECMLPATVYVENKEILLNLNPESISGDPIGSLGLDFKARFNGISHDIFIPWKNLVATMDEDNNVYFVNPIYTLRSFITASNEQPAFDQATMIKQREEQIAVTKTQEKKEVIRNFKVIKGGKS